MVTFDNTLPHGGPTICRSYTPGPFNITAASNDTLTFIIDGTSIYVGLTAGAAQTADQVAADINTAFGAAGLDGDRRRDRRRVRARHVHEAHWRRARSTCTAGRAWRTIGIPAGDLRWRRSAVARSPARDR